MCAAEVEQEKTGAEGVRWNLTDFYQSPDDPQIAKDWETSTAQAQTFEQQYRGKINSNDLTAETLATALSEYEKILELEYKPVIYAVLVFNADTTKGPFMQVQQERAVKVGNHLRFFGLELAAAPDDVINSIINDPSLKRFRHYVEVARLYRPYLLSEAEERIDAEKSVTGPSAWSRYFDEVVSRIKVKLNVNGQEQEMPLDSALKYLHSPERATRSSAAKAITQALESNSHALTYIFNTLVNEHAIEDRLRNRPDPMTERNLSNEIDPETVEALLSACDANVDIVQRYYRLKGKLLGIELTDYDRYAPLLSDEVKVAYDQGQQTVLTAFGDFSSRMSEIANEFFTRSWIDAEPRENKSGGAFSASTIPSLHPYILMNYMGQRRDVQTLAHELGHGIHQYLSRKNGLLGGADQPLTLAEMASVFCEMLVFYYLLEHEQDPKQRLALLTSKLEDTFATVFRQAIMARFEQRLHNARRTEGELPAERIGELWLEANRHMFGDVLKLTTDYGVWWSYIPHFVQTPFYVYAYAFGELLVMALFQKYRTEGKSFVPRYLELLEAGGSDWPHNLLEKAGVDITDKNFWQQGLDLIRSMVEEAEKAAVDSGMLKSPSAS